MAIGNESNKSAEQNRKYCHQWQWKKMDFMAYCKKLNKDKPCTVPYCHTCLLNRYGENAKEVDKLEDWNCPKCQGICNCSNCMQNKGHRHTGSVTHAATKSRFSSVHELLDHHTGSEIMNSVDMAEVPNASPYCPYKPEKIIEAPEEYCEEYIVLPQGSPLIEVASVKFPPKDVGSASQFLEVCNTFAKVLDIKEGQLECILRDLLRGRIGCCGLSSPVVQFNIKSLSMEENINEENWVHTLGRCITKSQCRLDILSLDIFDDGLPGDDNLDQSEKLRILNFLCDEILWTVKPRNCFDEEMQSSTMK